MIVGGFNLLSEILFVQAFHRSFSLLFVMRFNLLSEILFVQAMRRPASGFTTSEFQSLERDSVCSSVAPMSDDVSVTVVSIS